MVTVPFDLDKAHRWFANECNNEAWEILEKRNRTEAETDRMVHLAHAACLHWSAVGTPLNHLRALHLLANVYCRAGRPETGREYAERCIELSNSIEGPLSPFDQAMTFQSLALALALCGRKDEAAEWKARARLAGGEIPEAEDRNYFRTTFIDAGDWAGVE